jgi:hypothetical protein
MSFKAMLSKLIVLSALPKPVEYEYVEFDEDGEPADFYTPIGCDIADEDGSIILSYWSVHWDHSEDPTVRTFDDIEVEVDDSGFVRLPGDKVGFFFTVSRAAVLSDFPALPQGQGD